MDCLALSIDPESKLLVSTRPVFGGNAHATMVSRTARPQMATMRAKTVPPAQRDDSRQGQVIPIESQLDPSAIRIKVVERVKEEVDQSGKWRNPVVTEIVDAGPFYEAEDYHQDYLVNNPGGYTCHYLRE